MRERVETEEFAVWLEDGIVHLGFAPGLDLTLEKAIRYSKMRAEHFREDPLLLLISLEGIRSIDRDARAHLSNLSGATAVALVGLSPVARVLAAIFLGLTRRASWPVRTFASQEAAAAWLRTFLHATVSVASGSGEETRR